jgi:PTH2 family peptidyl-tRNA hydrolase
MSRVSFKQVIVIRRDLGMGTGKIAAQAAHAAVMAAEKTKAKKPEWFEEWRDSGQAKVVVKVKGMVELREVLKRAESLHLPVVEVKDSGLTQVPPGTLTCIGIGPGPSDLIDRATSHLRLL